MKSSGFKFILLSAFIEGGALMLTELVSAKMLSPYYGNSIEVWAGVLGMTLSGLAAGYFTGNYLSRNGYGFTTAFISLLVAGVYLAFLAAFGKLLLTPTLMLSTEAGIILSNFLLLFIPLTCLGSVSPLFINGLTSGNEGKRTGLIYGISTAGGIVFSVLTGFVLIPYLGVWQSAALCGALLITISVTYLVFLKK